MLEWLDARFAEVRPDVVSVEDDTGRGAGARTLRGYHTVAMLCARKAGASYRCAIGASRARKIALGTAAGGNEGAVTRARTLFGLTLEPRPESLTLVGARLTLDALQAHGGYREAAAVLGLGKSTF